MVRHLCAAGVAALCLTFSRPGLAQPVADHLKCYKVARDPLKTTTYTADLGGLVPEPGCRIRMPAAMACVPSTKTNVMPMPPGEGGTGTPNSFFCYKVQCPRAVLPTITGSDQFGSRIVTPRAARLLCAPLAGPSTTTTTSTNTTTTTLMSGGCPLPATGQTTCWDSTGNTIPCTGTGQDGDTLRGPPLAYMDNGDGTVTDINTGLMWEKKSDDGSIHDKDNTYTWLDTFEIHVAMLNSSLFAGYDDWRMPNARELASLVDFENTSPAIAPAFNNNCTAGCTVLTCSCTQSNWYWSSTNYAFAPEYSWAVHFPEGVVSPGDYKTGNSQYARAVRGGS